ncbi:WYL domain-containing protein [Colwellia chukchiensis]|uniref:WYL domain-containing protein n=1 Tax=Colwellia chukchiensis TaxID=641665 RepID=A0A1H7Q359_9GAMM|nr:WYL domain-containing protein [Colwellia chukchiensis]
MNVKRDSNDEIKWDMYLRLRLIEMVTMWEGRLTTVSLTQGFGIKRQQGSRDIAFYRKQCPENLYYCTKTRGYLPTESFSPKFTRGDIGEYLKFLSVNKDAASYITTIEQVDTPIEILSPPNRIVDPRIVRSLIKACRNRERIDVTYASMKNPLGEERNIIPHTFVSSGYRWHLRAFCEKDRIYKDFVLGRFIGEVETIATNIDTPEDKAWNTFIDLKIIPNPEYSDEQQQLIAREWGMTDMCEVVTIRAALAQYYLILMHIPYKGNYEGVRHRVILENLDVIKPYLMSS